MTYPVLGEAPASNQHGDLQIYVSTDLEARLAYGGRYCIYSFLDTIQMELVSRQHDLDLSIIGHNPTWGPRNKCSHNFPWIK
jgi:hypothetical protein